MLRLRVVRLGPLRDVVVELPVGGGLAVFFGEPGSGKSYVMRGVYACLSVLDPAARFLCPPRRPRLLLLPGAVEVLSSAIAAVVFSALEARVGPDKWAGRLGLRVSRYTVRERGGGAAGSSRIQLELRLRRDSQTVVARYEGAGLVKGYVEGMQRCVAGKLLPQGSVFSLEAPLVGQEPAALGAQRVLLVEEAAVEAPQGCRVYIGSVTGEVSFERGEARLRAVEALVEASERCRMVEPRGLARVLAAALPGEELLRGLSRGLARAVDRAARSLVSRSLGVGDVAYVAFTRSSALLLRSLASRLGSLGAIRTLRRLLREPETAPLGLAYARISRGLQGGERRAEHLLRLLAGGRVEARGGGLVFSDEKHGVEIGVHYASALASEVSSLALIVRGLGERPMLLLEEPEAQLHPRHHVALAALLPALAESLGGTLVFSTHSDLLVSALASLAQAPEDSLEERLEKLVAETLLRGAPGSAEPRSIARLAAKAIRRGTIFYLFADGAVRRVSPSTVAREAPSHSAAYDALASAAL